MRRSSSCLLLLALVAACTAPAGSAVGRVTWAGTAVGDQIEITLVGPVTRATRTDAEGTWVVRQLPPGEYVVVAEARDTLERSVTTTIQIVDRRQLEATALTLTRVGKISGTVTLAGSPSSEGASVLVVGGAGAAQTAADGSFVLAAIPTGKRDLWVHAPGFHPQQLSTVEVQHGATTSLPPIALVAVEGGAGPLVGSLRGRAWMPGTDDHAGIRVEIPGTAFSTLTAADGAFALEEVPSGVVTLSFRKGAAAAELSRVLVVSGANGFIVDQGLYDLAGQPIPLRRGERILDGEGGVFALAPDGQWAILRSTESSRLFLFGADGRLQQLDEGVAHGALGFAPADSPSVYWFSSYDPRLGEYSLKQTALATGITRSFGKLPHLSGFRAAITQTGIAWVQAGTLHLSASPSAPPIELFGAKASGVASLSNDSVLALAASTLHEVRLDGTLLHSTPVLADASWSVVSADRRWVVVGTGGQNGVVIGAVSMLIDRTLRVAITLPSSCTSPNFSPESDMLLCNSQLHRLGTDGTISSQTLASYPYPFQWLPGSRLALANPPTLRILAPGQADLVVGGIGWESLTLYPTTDGKRIKLLANLNPLTGLSQALEVTLADGAVSVLAEGVSSQPFRANDRGVVIGRPRTVGTDLDLFFVPSVGPEVALGRTAKNFGVTSSAAATFFGLRRFAPGRGYESLVLDSRGGAEPLLPIALEYGFDRWLDDRRLLQYVSKAAPFRAWTGLYLVEAP